MDLRILSVSAVIGACSVAAFGQHEAAEMTQNSELREFTGTYQSGPNAYLYMQIWNELSGAPQLVAFDESGTVRSLYPEGNGRFVAGTKAGVRDPVESTIQFERDADGKITSLTWQKGDSRPLLATHVRTEKREDITIPNGSVRLAGTLSCPISGRKRPAVVLVPASGPEDREYLLPFAHFLVRRGVAVLGYDKRGVGGSTGDWKTESFDDLASDAMAAYAYLRTRPEIDRSQIGLLGLSQAGWVMPLAAVRAQGVAFLISISGAGVSPAETTIDEARGEMAAAHTPPGIIEQVVTMMKLQYAYAQTGQGWNEYIASRAKLVERMGKAPATIPGTQDDPYWKTIRALYLYDPGPTLRRLQTPTLALFGERDDNIVAEKNRAAWESALKAAGNRDYSLRILRSADHVMLEAKVGNNAEEPTLDHLVRDYFTTVQDWLATRIWGFQPSPIGPSPLQ
jgi:uncharacterized protein